MSKVFDRLMTTIRPHLPGAVDEAIVQELFLTCKEYFDTSLSWQEEVEFVVPAGGDRAQIMPFTGNIILLVGVLDEGDRPVRGVYLSNDTEVVLRYKTNRLERMRAVVALSVSDPVDKNAFPIVPAHIVQGATEDLIHGILARMMSQPSKPYSNLALAQYHSLKFNGGAHRARNAMRNGRVLGGQTWAFPQSHRIVR